MTNRPKQDWSKQARKVMIDKDLNVSQLAQAIGMTRQHVSSVLNGRIDSINTKTAICSYLGIDT